MIYTFNIIHKICVVISQTHYQLVHLYLLLWSDPFVFLCSSLRAWLSLVISSIIDIHWGKNTCKIKFSKISGNLFQQYWAIYISYQIHNIYIYIYIYDSYIFVSLERVPYCNLTSENQQTFNGIRKNWQSKVGA